MCITNMIEESAVAAGHHPLEHVVPQSLTAEGQQHSPNTRIGDKATRSGLTLTCERCNQAKGRRLDAPFRKAFAAGALSSDFTVLRSAVLAYAYLFGFCVFGYPYVLDRRLACLRNQFAAPDQHATPWLDSVILSIDTWEQPVVLNASGYPFMVAEGGAIGLLIMFWRCGAFLPERQAGPVVEIPSEIVNKAGTSA